jgi:aspartate/methionine/tyrosine aminotransferase
MPIEIESPEQLGYDTIAHNLSESSVADRSLDDLGLELDLGGLTLCYGDHLGDPALREQVAADGATLHPDQVLVTAGAAAALFAVSTSQLGPGDHAVVVRTNYATNIETPLAIGADVDFLDLRFEDAYRIDLDRLAALLRPETRLVSITVPHNPTGTMCSGSELEAVVDLVERHGATLLCDETYRALTHDEPLPLAADLSERAVSIASLSKAYGLPGLRVGWAVTRDDALREVLLAAKEQIVICGATLDEAIGAAVLRDRERIMAPIRATVADHLRRVTDWVATEPRVEWVPPTGGVVCFPRIRAEVGVDLDRFYDVLLARHGTYVGPGHWFDADRRHFRLGYGWPTTADLDAGLAGLSKALDDAAT